ncbi:hypothetical protein PHJA_002833300 [Phtheirospermum japonicum]|uniref:Uncharacterized protein n=1 Tax=Phtheirospermum japonicum TaxID=374723 RepID=A0A830D8A4_9LAMI|nr:hypothetical protein PHJA_002833300 [Phtheirospermum japonicum]
MASTSSLCLPIQSFDPFFRAQIIKPNSNRKMRIPVHATKRETHDQDFNGRLVDESLIVLRKRMHEVKMSESNYEAPMEWMDWEKQFYASYDSTICDAMGHLQTCLMETRPGLALGMVALIAISVPISTAVVMYNLLELIKGVLVGIHLIS